MTNTKPYTLYAKSAAWGPQVECLFEDGSYAVIRSEGRMTWQPRGKKLYAPFEGHIGQLPDEILAELVLRKVFDAQTLLECLQPETMVSVIEILAEMVRKIDGVDRTPEFE
jgi:hypothetical protein